LTFISEIPPSDETPVDDSYRSLFAVSVFKPLMLSTALSRVATQMFSVVLVLFVLETDHSAQLSGLVVLCSQVPGIIVSPFAGAMLDRGAKVRLMVFDFGFEAVTIGALGVLSLLHELPTYLLILIVAVGALTTPLSRVGGRSIFPVIVPGRCGPIECHRFEFLRRCKRVWTDTRGNRRCGSGTEMGLDDACGV